MRKISNKKKKALRQKRNNFILSVVLIIIMLGSTFGVIINSFGKKSSYEEIQYNGFLFYKNNNYWFTNINDMVFIFKYNPIEITENIINGKFMELSEYKNKPLYIYSENEEATLEIRRNLEDIVQRIQFACPENNLTANAKCDESWPIKSCDDNFIIILNNNEQLINQNNKCTFIINSEDNLVKTADEFLFNILNIRS